MPRLLPDVAARYWQNIEKGEGKDACWIWTGARSAKGYGLFRQRSGRWTRVVRAHRLSYVMHVGPIPGGYHVLHSCDEPACVRPEHLRLGTDAENIAERSAKGRTARQNGAANGRAKLTETEVVMIRESLESEDALARRFGVSRASIGRVRRGEGWRHLARVAGAVLTSAALLMVVPSAVASESYRERSIDRFGKQEVRQNERLHAKWTKAAGAKIVGRNVVEHGMPKPGPRHRLATRAEWRETNAVLDRWENPPPPPEPVYTQSYSEPSTSYTAPAPTGGSGGVSGCDAACVQCESGGDYSTDTGNGYYGAYQFDEDTWDAYGDPAYPEANDAPPAVQDQAAASVPYDAWPNC